MIFGVKIINGKRELLNDNEEINIVKSNRENKGKSLIDFPEEYVVLDIETTGLDCTFDEIIEIAAIKVKNNEIVDEFETLIKPTNEINGFITDLTGITNEMVKDAPTINIIIPKLNKFIEKNIIVGHNVNFDINFLYDTFVRNNLGYLSNNFVDTMRLSRKILPDLKHHRLKDLVKYYKLDGTGAHRALNDVIMTNNVLLKLKKDVLDKNMSIQEFKKTYRSNYKFSDITSTIDNIDETNIFYEKNVTITGTLEKMQRKEAMQLLANLGANCRDNVTKETNYLILGNNDYNSILRGKKSSKLIKAENLKLKGNDIDIISENVFYDIVENHFKKGSVNKC